MKTRNNETHKDEWERRSSELVAKGQINKMKDAEIFDLTWRTTTEFICKELKLTATKKIFDAGYGWGRVIHGIKSYIPRIEIDGVELTKNLCEEADLLIERFNFTGVKLHCGDILDLSKFNSESYDAVYSTRVIHYVVDKEKALSNLFRILKYSGDILIIVPNRYCPYRWYTYKHPLFSVRKLKSIMNKVGFRDLKWGSYGFSPTVFGRFPKDSRLYYLENVFQRCIGINKIGGLAFVKGKKL